MTTLSHSLNMTIVLSLAGDTFIKELMGVNVDAVFGKQN